MWTYFHNFYLHMHTSYIYIYTHQFSNIYIHTHISTYIYICMKIHIRKSDVSKEKLNRKKLSHVRSGSIFSRIHSLWVWLLCHAEEAPLSKLMLTD